MKLSKLKDLRSSKGFTIVELLIVIIVIAILATLVITAYNGVQAKARDVKRKSDATEVQKAAQAYYADNGTYPTSEANFTASGNTVKLDTSITLAQPTSSSKDSIGVLACPVAGGAGVKISYWSEQTGAVVSPVLTAGDTSGTCSSTYM